MRTSVSLVYRTIQRHGLAALICVLLSVLGATQSSAQLTVSLSVVPPYSSNLDVWMSNPSRVMITILNTDPTRSYDIRLAGTAKNGDESVVLETRDDAPSPSIRIEAGGVKQLTLRDFRVFDANMVRFKGTSSSMLARSHTLPDGMYTICARALDYATRAPLSPDAPSGCATFEIKSAEAPILVYPPNEGVVELEKAQVIHFQWLPPVGAPPSLTYQLTLVELPDKQDAEGMLRKSQAFGLRRDGLASTSLVVQSAELQLQQGKRYAWRVRAVDPSNSIAFRNDGYSAAGVFDVGTKPIEIVKPKLKRPDTLVAGSFEIVVQKWDSASKSLDPKLPSGIGCIKFDCSKSKMIAPWQKDAVLKAKSFDIVGTPVMDSMSQLHISEAQAIEPSAQIGQKMFVELPTSSVSIADQLVDRSKLVDFFKLYPKLDCIRVAFHDVEWAPPTKSKVVLTGGTAVYPSSPASPTPPAMLVLDSGFTLAIDSLILTTTEATVQGKLLLPKEIVSADTCTRAFLKLPKTTITSNCEFYREVIAEDSAYGQWWLGNSGIKVKGDQYIIDFSSTQSATGFSPPLPASWKGVVLRRGMSDAYASSTVISNRGYTKAAYKYLDATITIHGFNGSLLLPSTLWRFTTLEPFGYEVILKHGELRLANSEITGGTFTAGEIALPKAAIHGTGGTQIYARYDSLAVQNDMDLFGEIKMHGRYEWGEFSRTTGTPTYYSLEYEPSLGEDSGSFYLAARQLAPYYPADSLWHEPMFYPAVTVLESQRMQGITLPDVGRRAFTVFTPDVPTDTPKKLIFPKETIGKAWLNIIRSGVHADVFIWCDSTRLGNMLIGDSLRDRYDGERSFKTSFGICFGKRAGDQQQSTALAVGLKQWMPFQFCESAVWNSELAGEVTLPKPADVRIAFKNMMFTSTTDCAGGQVDLSKPDTLPYWGVQLVAKDTAKSAGIICARRGVIYLTAAGVAEPRHYSKPFWLTWGEFKADGNLGRLYFDYNSVGQRFDGFPFTPAKVRLSDYQDVDKDTARILMTKLGALSGSLYSFGTVSVHFFGAKDLSISDYKLADTSSPYRSRWIRIQEGSVYGSPPSDIHWKRDWAGGIANFDYTHIAYDSAAQDGFFGTGTCTLLEITGGISSIITIRAERMCFSMSADAAHDINLSVVANFSAMEKIWGCGCIVGDNLEKVVVGGEISTGFGVGSSLAARGGGMLAIKLSFLPTQTKISLQGDMYVLLASSVNAEVSGMAELTEDHGVGYVEGYLKGTVQMSTFLAGISAEGELQWHFGLDYQMVQGRVAVGIYGPVQMGMESGVFLGVNCPKSKIWVTDGINSRFSFNKGGLPTNLTGMYAFISISQSINLYIVSGGYEVYTGIGAFVGTSPPIGSGFGVMGNVGVRIWGEILGGLVSASAWGNLQFIAGAPPAFEGSIGLEACVLWVFCGSVDVHCGYNRTDGLYLY